jgi:hypothetical protein
MKRIIFITIPALILIGLFSCKKINGVKPGNSNTSKPDTSTTLISNTELVGNWNVVTDSISFLADTMYYGTPADHYIFTKYANMYIKSTLNNFTDTAVYTIANVNELTWINSYGSIAGSIVRGPSSNGTFIITSLTAHSLVLTQNFISTEGPRFEVITFKK